MPTVEQQQILEIRNPGTSVTTGSTMDDQEGRLRDLENPSNTIQNIRYPLDLGTDTIYKHLMRINIYKQRISKFQTGTLGPNAFDDEKAGASKVKEIDNVIVGGAALGIGKLVSGAAGVLGGSAAETVVNGAGKAAAAATGLAAISGKSLERKTVKEPVAYISLYMPETLIFTDRHDFDPVSVTEALGSVGVAGAVVPGGGGFTAGETGGAAAEASGMFGNGIKDIALFGEGYAMNPQLEILYKGSKNRQFIYSFKFTPRSQKEAEAVESIIKTLRFHASPEYGAAANASRYFIPPSEFDIEFYIGAEKNTHLPRIAQCVLENIDVNYAAAGQYSTFVDGTPVEITMQITFTETIVLTKEDIDSGF
jgi:hypothetical protein